jgi:hypothetical protein
MIFQIDLIVAIKLGATVGAGVRDQLLFGDYSSVMT